MTERVRTLAGGEPSQSKPAALPALPKGELLDGVRNLTASKKPLPLGEVALRSNDGEGKDACGRRTLSVKACGFASSPKGRALRRGEEPCGTEKPLPLGEVALRSNDGEGEDALPSLNTTSMGVPLYSFGTTKLILFSLMILFQFYG